MAQAPRDGNEVVAKMGSYNGTPIPLVVDHVTGYLKASIAISSFVAPVVTYTNAPRDNNQVPVSMGSYNDTVKPLLVTHADGYLRAVIM